MSAGRDLSELWDLGAVASDPLGVQVVGEGTTGRGAGKIVRRELRFHSHEWAGVVTLAAYVALPASIGPVPAVIMGTGDPDSAEAFSRRHRVATVLFDRPGTGQSTGPEDLYENWVRFDDPRESWMWHYVQSALRTVTLARTLPEVDPERLALTGSSRGGTMAWIANGVDPRLKLALPVATGGDIVRALDHGGWANFIYRDEEGQPSIPSEFFEFARYYDPLLYCGRQHGAVVLMVGAQDEFFPIFCTATSARASAEDDFRLLLIANWDHGYFSGDNPQVHAFDNSREVSRKRARTVEAALAAWLRGERPMPRSPELTVETSGGRAHCRVRAEGSQPVRRVRVYASFDGAYTFRPLPARRARDGFAARLSAEDSAAVQRAALYAEVEYAGGPFLTSIPWLGPEFRQVMRPFPEG